MRVAGDPMTLVDRLSPEAFMDAMTQLFEGAPRFLARLAAARPFGTGEELFQSARAIAHSMPEADQVELVDAHPRLGAPPGSVSALSFEEQGYGVESEDPDVRQRRVAAELERLNEAYEARFGFRYCVFVAGRTREALLPGFAEALQGERGAELHRALDAVVDIARDRHRTLAHRAVETTT
jgi:2-oxo-4-hydroxy-4-carboxy--5-ureidoimidazoline (OHCU) decarboxylase